MNVVRIFPPRRCINCRTTFQPVLSTELACDKCRAWYAVYRAVRCSRDAFKVIDGGDA